MIGDVREFSVSSFFARVAAIHLILFVFGVFGFSEFANSEPDNSSTEFFSKEDLKLFEENRSPFFGMPDSYFDLLRMYDETDASTECQSAAKKLVQRNRSITTFDIWSSVSTAHQSSAEHAEYFNACLDKLSSMNLPDYLISDVEEYIGRTGIFVTKTRHGLLPFCGGVRIDNELVLTAKHCFFNPIRWELKRRLSDPEVIPDSEIGVELSIENNVRFIEFRNLNRRLNVALVDRDDYNKNLFYPKSRDKLHLDQVLVRLTDPGNEQLASLQIEKPKQWEKLWFASLAPVAGNYSDINSSVSESKSGSVQLQGLDKFADRIFIDDRPTCYIWAISRLCIFHSCQTMAGLSGTPLIGISRDNGLSIMGVHTGAVDKAEDNDCGFTRGKWIVNRGVFPVTR